MRDRPGILIVDESPADRAFVERAATSVAPDARIMPVWDAVGFEEALLGAAPDLVVTEYRLRFTSGLEVLRRARSQWPDCPVLIVTGSGDETVAVDAMKLGAADYVSKTEPHGARLPAAIRSALDGRPEGLASQLAERRYRMLLEHLPLGVYRSLANGTIIDANHAFAQLFGWADPREAIGQSVLAMYADPTDRLLLLKELRDVGEVRNRTVRLRRIDGGEIWVELSVRHLDDHSGSSVMHGTVRDVTDELAARQQMVLLASALEAAGDAIMVTDTGGVIEWVNPSFTAMTGYTLDEARGQRTTILKSGTHGADFYRTMWRRILAGRVWRGEVENRRKDGRVYAEQMSITPVRGRDGSIAHFVAVKRDVSEQRTLEAQFRQAQKMEAIGQLAGGIAHDFNNLMTAILGYCEILLSQMTVEDPNRADVQEIRSAGQRASALTRQLLAFSRKQILQPTTFDIRDVVAGMDKMLRRVVRADISLTVQPADRPLFVRADVGQVEQVILNLVINASDAMPEGGALTVSTRREDLTGDFVRSHPGATTGPFVALEIRDSGVGMPPEVLGRIFEPFFTTKPQGKGTGLGLSMVYGIVKQSGGYVAAVSAPGEGSTFTVYLPEEAEPAAAVVPEPLRNETRAPFSATVLVAEDDPTIRDLVCRVLARGGFNVVAGGSAREALESLESMGDRPDLLLTDVVMPETNGVELARIVRESHPDLPVVFMSGYHDLAGIAATDARASDRLLHKPVSPDVLLQAVHESLGTVGCDTASAAACGAAERNWVTP